MTKKTLTTLSATAVLGAFTATSAAAQVGENMGLINPNRAGQTLMTTLPHVGPTVVAEMMEQRPFLGMTDLHGFLVQRGLTTDQLAQLYGRMFLPLNLNTAPDEEIALIPGVPPELADEFRRQRPYVALAQFRREIGQAVDVVAA